MDNELESLLKADGNNVPYQLCNTATSESCPEPRHPESAQSHQGKSREDQPIEHQNPSKKPSANVETAATAENIVNSEEPKSGSSNVAVQGSKPAVMAAEGFLAICGGCANKVLFPLGSTRIYCSTCGSINYMAPQLIPSVSRKALLVCPSCKAAILYTIGCTHFQCTCGSVIEIPLPDYYLPHFPQN